MNEVLIWIEHHPAIILLITSIVLGLSAFLGWLINLRVRMGLAYRSGSSEFSRPFIEVTKTSVMGDDSKNVQIVFRNSGKHPTGEINMLTEIYILGLDQLEYATNSNLVTPFPPGGSFNQSFKYSILKMYQKNKSIFKIKISYSDFFFPKKYYDQIFWFTYVSGEIHLNNSRQEEIKALEDKISKKQIRINPDLPGYSKC